MIYTDCSGRKRIDWKWGIIVYSGRKEGRVGDDTGRWCGVLCLACFQDSLSKRAANYLPSLFKTNRWSRETNHMCTGVNDKES